MNHHFLLKRLSGDDMNRTFLKTMFRDFKKNLSRFIAIIAIMALGVGFLIGLLSATPTLQHSVQQFYNQQNMFDIDIKSTIGFDKEDVVHLKQDCQEISEIEAFHQMDYEFVYENQEITTRFIATSFSNSINKVKVIKGEYPKSKSECLIQNMGVFYNADVIGKKLYIEDLEYTITGICESSVYFYKLSEMTTIGNGDLNSIVYVDAVFHSDLPITDIVVTLKSTKKYDAFGKKYLAYVENTKKTIETLSLSYIDQLKNKRIEEAYQAGYDQAMLSAKEHIKEEILKQSPNISEEILLSLVQEEFVKQKNEIEFAYKESIKETINRIDAEWYVLDRKSNTSYVAFEENSNKVNKVAVVFPFFFFFIAGLIALTSVTRLVHEDRSSIGTLKSLGYSNLKILGKYIFYAFFSCIIGCFLGLFFGVFLLPFVIFICYNALFIMPKFYFVWYHFGIILSMLTMSLTILLVMLFVCLKTLKEKPNALLVPKAPKAGKRILLERIGFIWNRLKFKFKSAIRNVFRFKRNLIMMIVGIGGCTGLMMVAFGLRDSIQSFSINQYENIIKYDFILNTDKQIDESIFKDSTTLYLYSKQVKMVKNKDYEVTILYTDEAIFDFMGLGIEEFGPNSVIISSQISSKFHIKKNDFIEVQVNKEIEKFKVTHTFTNYIGNYIIVHKSQRTEEDNNTIYVKLGVMDQERYDEISKDLHHQVSRIEDIAQTKKTYASLSDGIGFVIILILLCSGILAVIVIYNLTNININERIKEIATLKVLGYHRSEVLGFIFREIIIMSFLGILAGFILGPVLNYFVMTQISSPGQCFSTQLSIIHYVSSFGLTIVFILIVLLLFIPKIKKIQMVESLKSVE